MALKKKKDLEVVEEPKEKLDSQVLDKIVKKETKKESKEDLIENYVALIGVNKYYDKGSHAVIDFNLEIAEREFVVFVGPSGCGKSTTLRMIAGLEEITSGELYIAGQYSNDITPQNRDIAMVFQNYSLYPNMTVYDNMAFGLKVRKVPKNVINERVMDAANKLQITEYLDRKPKALSGGQRQRVALGRAVVREAKVFLMDEPLSNLDAKLRVSMRSEIVQLHRRIKATTIYVTHDQIEAMTMADRIVVMDKGLIQQVGTPKEIYHHPANKFVASFIGTPAMNFTDCRYDKGVLKFKDNEFTLSAEQVKKHDLFYSNLVKSLQKDLKELDANMADLQSKISSNEKLKKKELKKLNISLKELEDKKDKLVSDLSDAENVLKTNAHDVIFGIRPEDVKVSNSKNAFSANIVLCELLGDEYYMHFDYNSSNFLAKVPSELINDEEVETMSFSFEPHKIHLFDKNSERSIL